MKTRLMITALALGLLATGRVASQAQGTIVYRDLGSFWFLGAAGAVNRYNLDFNGDNQTDFILESGEAFEPIGIGANAVYSYPEPPGEFGALAIPLAYGEAIGPALRPGALWYGSYVHPNPPHQTITAYFHYVLTTGAGGLWRGGTAYMGAQFEIEGNIHYGWLRIEVPDPLRGNGGIIHDLAYNAVPNMPILAGQVPEPGTWALWLAGAGLLGWRTWRRRQRI